MHLGRLGLVGVPARRPSSTAGAGARLLAPSATTTTATATAAVLGLLCGLTRHGAHGILLGLGLGLVLLGLDADDLFLGLDLGRRRAPPG